MTSSPDRKAARQYSKDNDSREIYTDDGIEELPAYTVVHDSDGDIWVKNSDASWSEVDGGSATDTDSMQRYAPLRVLNEPMTTAPPSDERLISLLQRVLAAYDENKPDILHDAMLTLRIELTTLEVPA